MATLLRLNTKFDSFNDNHERDSAFSPFSPFLYRRFWDAVHLDCESFNDDMSTCCNADYTFFGEQDSNAFNRICNLAADESDASVDKRVTLVGQDPFPALDFTSTRSITPFGKFIIAASEAFMPRVAAITKIPDWIDCLPARPGSPMRNNLSRGSTRSPSPGVIHQLMMDSSVLNNATKLTQAPFETPAIKEAAIDAQSNNEILESDVLVNVIEETEQLEKGSTELAKAHESHPNEQTESLLIPIIEICMYGTDNNFPLMVY